MNYIEASLSHVNKDDRIFDHIKDILEDKFDQISHAAYYQDPTSILLIETYQSQVKPVNHMPSLDTQGIILGIYTPRILYPTEKLIRQDGELVSSKSLGISIDFLYAVPREAKGFYKTIIESNIMKIKDKPIVISVYDIVLRNMLKLYGFIDLYNYNDQCWTMYNSIFDKSTRQTII